MYELPREARQYALFQRTNLLPKRQKTIFEKIVTRLGFKRDDYNSWVESVAADDAFKFESRYFAEMEQVAKKIVAVLPPNVDSILDVGCGIATVDLFLDTWISPNKIFLLDKTKTEDAVWYMFREKGAFYNSLDLAKMTLELNGVSESKIELISAPDNGAINLESGSIDVVISTISWGFHYPISLYLNSIYKLMRNEAVLIIDVRIGSGGYEELENVFEVQAIDETHKFQTLKCVKKQIS